MEEEDSLHKLSAHVKIKSGDQNMNPNLVLFTRNYLCGSFQLSLHRLCFRHFFHKGMVLIDNNFFRESENSALSRDSSGPKSNHRLHVSGGAIV